MDASRLNASLTGRYTIERELGAGGMATVYLAHDVKHDRHVALKVLKPELAAVLGAERFVVEIKTTAALQHPHILPLFDSGTADSFLFYVMPFIDGETLRTKLDRETQLGVDDAVRIAREVLDALEYAHQHGIVHRDIKPENILLHGGHAMVADFGIALAVSAAAGGRMTETGLSLGTPHYMSPEQATAEKEITARSDVYSLGSVLYEMLTGNPPHTGASAQQIIMKIITEAPAPVTQLRKSVPPNVAAAVARSLEKLPADRFESAKAFGDALGNPAFTTASASTGGRALAGSRGVPVWALAASYVVAVAVAVAVTWWITLRRAEPSVAVHFAFATAPNQPLGVLSGRSLAVSPAGRLIVYATGDSAGRLHLYARGLSELEPRPLAGSDGAGSPFFSPDGQWIGFFIGRQLNKIPVTGGAPTALASLDDQPFGASWGPTGIVVSINGRLALVPDGGGAPIPVMHGDSARAFWPVVLPGGSAVVHSGSPNLTAPLSVTVLATGRTTAIGLSGVTPLGVAGGEIVYAQQDGALMAATFDAGKLRVTGAAHALGGTVLRVVGGIGETKAALSASGTLAYLGGSQSREVVVVDAKGTARPLPVARGVLDNLRYSPDGRRFAADLTVTGSTDIYVYDVASGAAQRLTSDGTLNQRSEWTADGKQILFRSNRAGPVTTLWQAPVATGGAAKQVVASPGKVVWEGVPTPDGNAVVYRTGTLTGADIWYRQLKGDTSEKAFATTRFGESAPRISPDGRWVAYFSDESGSNQVYAQPFPGPGARVPVSVGGGTNPVWSRDGRRIFFANGTQLVAASVVTRPAFAVTGREVILDGSYQYGTGHAAYDVAPDGRSFLILRPVSTGAEKIVVIYNWASELRAAARGGGSR